MKNHVYFKYWPSIIFGLMVLSVWEVYTGIVRESVLYLPSPSSIINSLVINRDIIIIHTAQTALETAIGFTLAIVLGFSLSILITIFPLFRRIIFPHIIISQTIPFIALAPLLLIWFGFDLVPKVIMVLLFCFFPITISTTGALINVNRDMINLLKSMNASSWQIMRLVRIPIALPSFFSGAKIAATYSVGGAIVGEFVGSYRGLGILMQTSANSHAYSLVFAAILIAVILSFILFKMVCMAEKLIIPWHFRQSK